MMQKQPEICPWCEKRIYVAPGRSQPCPKCRQLINVYPDSHPVSDVLRVFELALKRAKDELLDLELAIAGNLRVPPKTLKNSQMRVYRLHEELKKHISKTGKA